MIQLPEFLLTTLNDLLFIKESLNEIQRLVGGNSAIIALSSILKARLCFCRELLSPSFVMRTFARDGSEIIKGLEEVGNLCRIYKCIYY